MQASCSGNEVRRAVVFVHTSGDMRTEGGVGVVFAACSPEVDLQEEAMMAATLQLV